MEPISISPIAHIHTNFPTKFGIPRQSGVVPTLQGTIVFEQPYRVPEAFRGLEGFSHLWLLWQFSEAVRKDWSPTVRPPRLNGNTRMGVFATRSPFRPNHIGLSCVRLERVELHTVNGPVLTVSGIDLMDGTPILDLKPYIPYADSHPEAKEGFTSQGWERLLSVDFPPCLLTRIPSSLQDGLIGVLANDPRPPYQSDPNRVYGMEFGDWEIQFTVSDHTLSVCAVMARTEK